MTFLTCAVIASAAVHVAALGSLAFDRAPRRGFRIGAALAIAPLLAFSLSTRVAPRDPAILAALMCVVICAAYVAAQRRELWPAGAFVWSSMLLLGLFGGVRSIVFIAQMPVSATTRALLLGGAALVAVGLPASVVTQRESLEVLIRRRWRHQAEPTLALDRSRYPFVSIQVPCHAEPPDMVISTLDHLARLEYPAYEVLVIDNNTSDRALWRPVEDHCRTLGPRFRFLHVEGIEGAKAGALNWASQFVSPRAELIAVVDADYHVDPWWLSATVPFFDDETVGFVQPPHAYRDWERRRFGRMANFEYSMFFAAGMVALQEHEAGITVGTMSVIRRSALQAAGGWAEWCLTEDSELAIRIHALGYRSVYLREPLGWGLIPETFDGYRRQRFRWTYGPVQEFRRHWRSFLPRRLNGKPAFTREQRIHHANHGFDVAMVGVRFLSWPVALGAAASLLLHHERVAVPFDLWIAATALLVSGVVVRWLQYCRVTGASLREAVGAVVAYQALSHAIAVASLRAVFGLSASWHRTEKFTKSRHRRRAFATTKVETALAAVMIGAAIALISWQRGGLATMLAIGFAVTGLGYATTLFVALVAEHDLDVNAASSDVEPRPTLVAVRRSA